MQCVWEEVIRYCEKNLEILPHVWPLVAFAMYIGEGVVVLGVEVGSSRKPGLGASRLQLGRDWFGHLG